MKITNCYIFIIFMNYIQRFIIFHLFFFFSHFDACTLVSQ